MRRYTIDDISPHYSGGARANGGYWGQYVGAGLAQTVTATAREYIARVGLAPATDSARMLRSAGVECEVLLTVAAGKSRCYPRVYAPRGAVRLASLPLPASDRRELLRAWQRGGLPRAILDTASDAELCAPEKVRTR